MIDPSSDEAIYRQVARLLEARIDAEAEPGYVLPSAETLAREYQLGTDTVRDALGLLVHMGRLSLRRGHGAVVCGPPDVRTVLPITDESVVETRMSTFAEMDRWEMDRPAPMLVVDGQPYPGDRYIVRMVSPDQDT